MIYGQGFTNTADIEAGKDRFATAEGLLEWLQHHGPRSPREPKR